MAKKAAKTRNPQDSTRRNVQAANRKLSDLSSRVTSVGHTISFFVRELQQLREAHAHTAVNLSYLQREFTAHIGSGPVTETRLSQLTARLKAAKKR